jgi:hypothetical protein
MRATVRPATTDRLPLRARLSLLPLPERCFLLLLLACAMAPAMAAIYSDLIDPAGASLLGAAGRHPLALAAAGAVLVLIAVVALERPRELSVRRYGAQLARRFAQVQSNFDGALRRRLEEEQEHDAQESRQP